MISLQGTFRYLSLISLVASISVQRSNHPLKKLPDRPSSNEGLFICCISMILWHKNNLGENQAMPGYRNIDPSVGQKTQFKKGQSGNPSGPKPGYKHINTWVQELLHDPEFEMQIREGYNVTNYKGAPLPAIIKAQIRKAIDGDTKAFDSLVKSGWAQKTETDVTSDGKPLNMGMTPEQAEQLLALRAKRGDS